MADQWNSNIPAMTNQISADIPDIKENLEHAKDSFERIFQTWSTAAGGNASAKFNSATGFTDGTYNYEFPTNPAIAASSVIMLGNSDTVIWMYLNTAPPGWKALSTGLGTVLAVSDTTGLSNGSATSTTANRLIDSGATFDTDGVKVGSTAYNATDGTVATVTAVNSETNLTLDTDIFESGESYVVGWAFVEAGGRQASDGTWTISGITAATETDHTHGAGTYTATATSSFRTDVTLTDIGQLPSTTHTHDISGTSATGSTHGHAISHNGRWRPTGSIGKLFQLDTA